MPLALPDVIKYHVVDGREPTCRTAALRRGDSMDVALVVGRILFGLVFLGGAAEEDQTEEDPAHDHRDIHGIPPARCGGAASRFSAVHNMIFDNIWKRKRHSGRSGQNGPLALLDAISGGGDGLQCDALV